jgi:hypothetical protein
MHTQTRLAFLVVILLLSLSCKKEAAPVKPAAEINDPELNVSGLFYFRGTINGVYKDWTVTDYKNGEDQPYRYNTGSGVDTLGSDCVNSYCKFMIEDVNIFQNNGAGPTRNYIDAGFNIASKTGNRQDIISQFSVGQKIFGKPRNTITEPVRDGAYVYYIDENGKEWCTHFSSGNQANSIFNSVQLLPQLFPEIYTLNIWRARFSCTLYDRNGNSIRLENGEFYTPALVKL